MELQHYLRAAEGALRIGDRQKALAVADEASRKGIEHFHLLALAAEHELARGDRARALVLALRAHELNRRDVDVLNTLGVVHASARHYRKALKAFDAALREAPADRLVRLNKAAALEALLELERARREFERILDGEPHHVEALARLASLAVRQGDSASARTYAERALKIDPGNQSARLALATADIDEGRYNAALTQAQSLARESSSPVTIRASAQGLIGDALDGLGRTADAFDAYIAGKRALRAHYRPSFESDGQESSAKMVRRLADYFRDASPMEWQAADGESAGNPTLVHAFIVGFPRSGTTLLEQILATHPDVEVMGERDCLELAQNSFTRPPNGLERLAHLDADGLAPWRTEYWKRVAEEGFEAKKRVFVDKMPFYCVFLCVIAKLFPRARILFALRDPRDVILSCLRSNFAMTSQLFELTSLETAATHYDATMRLSEEFRRVLTLNFMAFRHEDLIADFEGETRRICAFLDLEWHAGLNEFGRLSHPVSTPSGRQVVRGLSIRGAGRWRRFRAQLAPVLPLLSPWAEKFGYASE